jgi:Ca-activated chloride channel family protein
VGCINKGFDGSTRPNARRSAFTRADKVTVVRLLIAFVVAVAATPSEVGAQSAHFRGATSDLVVLSATIVDKDGGPVEGLERDLFTVYDEGARQRIDLFTNEDTPVSVGLIIDSSGSMRRKVGEVVAATVTFAKLSHPEDELFALAFNDEVRETSAAGAFLRAGDLTAVEKAVSSMRPEGRTALYDAVIAGLDRLEMGSQSRKVLIVMSDGGDNASRATLDQVLDRARRSDATIYTIGLFEAGDPDANPGVLKSIAQATGGERFLPRSPAPLLRACQQIAREIRSGYTLAFEPPKRDGRYHRIRVELNRPNGRRVDVRTRPGYFAPAPTETAEP